MWVLLEASISYWIHLQNLCGVQEHVQPVCVYDRVISRILELPFIGMTLLIMMIYRCFILYWVKYPNAYEHDDLFCILGVSQLLMIHMDIYDGFVGRGP